MSLINPGGEWKRRVVGFGLLVTAAVCMNYYEPIGKFAAHLTEWISLGFGALCLVAFFVVAFERVRVLLGIRREL